jgi:hypothetical protein
MRYQTYASDARASHRILPSVSHSALMLGGLGAVVGAGNAIAKGNRQIKNQEISKQQAVEHVFNESLGTGLAVAAAAAVVGASRARGLTSLVGILAIAAGTKYLWDTAHSSDISTKRYYTEADQVETGASDTNEKSTRTAKKPGKNPK